MIQMRLSLMCGRRALRGMLLCAVLSLGAPRAAEAQLAAPQPGMIVFSQNICPFDNVPQLRVMLDSLFAPVLDELVAEGKLLGWALLSNWWGDEWNWNVYYTAESYQSFLNFWNDYVSRLAAVRPGWSEEAASLCTEHKDMFYNVVRASKSHGVKLFVAADSATSH